MKDSIWNHDPAKFVKECKRLRALCQRIIDGDEGVIEGSRKMLKFRFWLKEENNSAWTIFRVVDSESDHLPVGASRTHWDSEALKEKDKEITKVEDYYRDKTQEAARLIRDNYQQFVEQGRGAKALTRVAHD